MSRAARWFLLSLPFLLIGCKSKPPVPAQNLVAIAGKSTPIPSDIKLLFLKGSCDRGVFSPNGRMALALCTTVDGSGSLPQLFQVDLNGPGERRITWQDGTVGSADWLEDDLLVYSSTTDELKEIPFLPTKPAPDEIPSEIYTSDLVGDSIHRLTRRIGFDGDLSYWPKMKEVLFVSRRGPDYLVQKLNGKKGSTALLYTSKNKAVRFPAGLSDGRVAWLEASTNGVDMRILGKGTRVRLSGRHLTALRAAPGGRAWLAVESFSDGHSRVLLLGPEDSCEKTLLDVALDIRYVDATQSPPRLLLSASTGTQGVFALKELSGETFTCEGAPASVK